MTQPQPTPDQETPTPSEAVYIPDSLIPVRLTDLVETLSNREIAKEPIPRPRRSLTWTAGAFAAGAIVVLGAQALFSSQAPSKASFDRTTTVATRPAGMSPIRPHVAQNRIVDTSSRAAPIVAKTTIETVPAVTHTTAPSAVVVPAAKTASTDTSNSVSREARVEPARAPEQSSKPTTRASRPNSAVTARRKRQVKPAAAEPYRPPTAAFPD